MKRYYENTLSSEKYNSGVDLKKFKDDATNEAILLIGKIMSEYVFKKHRYKVDLHPKLFYDMIKNKIKYNNHIYDAQFLEDSGTVLLTIKGINVHLVIEIEPFGNTYDILHQFVTDSKTGEFLY